MADRPKGHSAVMAGRQGLFDDGSGGDPLDYFPTPPWAARAGGELIQGFTARTRSCWEPACGAGHMTHGLADYFELVVGSDIAARGHGFVADFLASDADWGADGQPDWIVSNPPFKDGEAFVRLAWERAQVGVAMLLRLSFLEGAGRFRLFTEDCPLTCVAPFCERVAMHKGRWDPDGSTATAYAWFVFMKGWPGEPVVRLIPPGTRERLTRRSDYERFAPEHPKAQSGLSLFGGGDE